MGYPVSDTANFESELTLQTDTDMFSTTAPTEVINDYNASTSTPAPAARMEFTPALGMASTPTVLQGISLQRVISNSALVRV